MSRVKWTRSRKKQKKRPEKILKGKRK